MGLVYHARQFAEFLVLVWALNVWLELREGVGIGVGVGIFDREFAELDVLVSNQMCGWGWGS